MLRPNGVEKSRSDSATRPRDAVSATTPTSVTNQQTSSGTIHFSISTAEHASSPHSSTAWAV